MCKASELAKYTINECLSRNFKIDTPKVQKLLVLMCGEYLAKYDTPLFPEDIEMWDCGVAIRKVNKDFDTYIFGIDKQQECYLALLNNEIEVIHNIVDRYGNNDVFEISQDERLVKLKEKYYDLRPTVIPIDFVKKVFKGNEGSC